MGPRACPFRKIYILTNCYSKKENESHEKDDIFHFNLTCSFNHQFTNRLRPRTLEGHTDIVYSVSFSPDGTTLASASSDGTVKLWDVATHENIATLQGHTDYVNSVSFSPDGTTLASASWDGTVKLWDVATRENIATS